MFLGGYFLSSIYIITVSLKGFGQLNQASSLSSTLNSGINISSAMGAAGSYQHYGLNAALAGENKRLKQNKKKLSLI